ncbi:MAG TPA: zinc ribbon domain-containing protein [Candidatus Limnocylindrales bacterium]|nr:zinc ribbon domain-containing protein [Candidatus Limnocylindrales bacterium]
MIVCKQCGHHNDDSDTFCGSCGKFLEWTGERVVVEQPPEPEPEPEPELEPVHPTFFDRVKQAVGIEETAPGAAPAAAPPVAPLTPPAVPAAATAAPAPAPSPAPIPAVAASAPTSTPVSAPLPAYAAPPPVAASAPAPAPPAPSAPPPLRSVPVSSASSAPVAPPAAAAPPPAPAVDEGISRKPVSVLPAPPRPRPVRRVQEAPTRHLPGDLICGQCGEGNDPLRHFCRRCGNSLDEALTVRLPWYRRLLNWMVPRRTRQAGWRPNRVGGISVMRLIGRLVRTAIVLLVALFLILFALVPAFRAAVQKDVNQAYNTARIAIHPNIDSVTLVSATASSTIPGHDALKAIDSFINTYWAARPQDAQPVLHIQFARPVANLAFLVIHTGPSGTGPADQFKAQPRPARLHLVYSDGTGQDVTVSDDPTVQRLTLSAKDVSSVDIHVLSTYPPLYGAPTDSSVAITEIEFQMKD